MGERTHAGMGRALAEIIRLCARDWSDSYAQVRISKIRAVVDRECPDLWALIADERRAP